MPNIPIKPLSPFRASPTTKAESLKAQQTFSGIVTLKGGLTQKHTIEVTDRSDDKLQYLPYHVRCTTCNFEAKLKNYGEAISIAQNHVGA